MLYSCSALGGFRNAAGSAVTPQYPHFNAKYLYLSIAYLFLRKRKDIFVSAWQV